LDGGIMEAVLQAKCSTIFEAVLTSPIGAGVMSYLTSNSSECAPSLLEIRDRLEESDYASPSDWLQDVTDRFNQAARDFGADSDLGLSILCLLQLIEDAAQPLLPRKGSIDLHELDEIIESFRQFAAEAPNSLEEFRAFMESGAGPVPEFQFPHDQAKFDEKPDEELDVYSLYQDVLNLPADRDVEKVVDIVSRYEVMYSHVNDVIEIDLTRCQPYTLRLIRNYVNQATRRLTRRTVR
jgi:hypothetical protein